MSEQNNEPQKPEKGAPPGNWFSSMSVPLGIEVLVKKAAVDPVFRGLLFRHRGRVAASIGLQLDPAEFAMLNDIPEPQLAQIVDKTFVSAKQKGVFLGDFGPAMLAALQTRVESIEMTSLGVRPDYPEKEGMKLDPSALQRLRGIRTDDAKFDAPLTEWLLRHRREWQRKRKAAGLTTPDEPGGEAQT